MPVTKQVKTGRTRRGPANLPSIKLRTYTVAQLPPAAANTGGIVYVSNGAAGAAVLAFSNGTNWLRADTNAAVAAS